MLRASSLLWSRVFHRFRLRLGEGERLEHVTVDDGMDGIPDIGLPPWRRFVAVLAVCLLTLAPDRIGFVGSNPRQALAEERRESFDADPHWDGHNHRSTTPDPRTVRQDFGFSPTNHAGGTSASELGGLITPAAEPAWYAKKIAPATFDDKL